MSVMSVMSAMSVMSTFIQIFAFLIVFIHVFCLLFCLGRENKQEIEAQGGSLFANDKQSNDKDRGSARKMVPAIIIS